MTRDDDIADALAAQMAAFHEALAQNAADAGDSDTPHPAETPIEAAAGHALPQDRLGRAFDCIKRLESVRRAAIRQADGLPRKIGRFEILEELGRGGYGVVFLGHDPQLDRRVALKIPRPESLVDGESRRRFLNESRAAAGLHHPNIVAIHEVGEAGLVCWIAAEYCQGPSLSEWLRNRADPVNPRTAALLVAQIADGVEHAHRHRVLHRDLKPGNVILVERGQGSRVGGQEEAETSIPKLTDFGLAKVLDDEQGQATQSGMLLGTPSYMAPEQIDPAAGKIGIPTDVYGLGAILYEILTGMPPFRGESSAETFKKITLEEPLGPRHIRREIPHDLEAIVLRCLEKSPERRYGTAGELADDLRRFLAGLPTVARPLTTPQRAIRWAKRRPAAAALAIVTLMSILGLGGGAVWHIHRLETALSVNRRQVYFGDMRQAQQAWRQNNLDQVINILKRYQPGSGRENERDFIWHYLWNRCQRQRWTTSDHQAEVCSAAFSPSGRLVVTVGRDAVTRIYETQTGKPRGELRGHGGSVNCVAFLGEDRLVTGSDDRTVRVWSVSSGEVVAKLDGHTSDVLAIAVSADGKLIASGSADKSIRLWDTSAGKVVQVLEGHTHWVRGLAFAPSGNRLYSVGHDAAIRVWSVDQGTCEKTIPVELHYGQCLAISRDGGLLAAGGRNGCFVLVDLDRLELIDRFRGDEGWIRSIAFAADGSELFTAGDDRRVCAWSLKPATQPKLLRAMPAHTAAVNCVVVSPDGKQLVTTSRDRSVKMWLADEPLDWNAIAMVRGEVRGQALSPDGGMVALSHGPQTTVWELDSGKVYCSAVSPSQAPRGCDWSQDGRWLAVANEDGNVGVWDLSASGEPSRWHNLDSGGDYVAFHPGNDLIAISDGTAHVEVRQFASGELSTRFSIPTINDTLGRLLFAPDGSRLVAGSYGLKASVVWDFATGQELFRLEEARGGMAISADGRLIAAGAVDKTVRVWDATNGELLHRLVGHDQEVRGVAFSPDGQFLASVPARGPVKMWSLETGDEVLSVDGIERWGEFVEFSKDGRRLFALAEYTQNSAKLVVLDARPREGD